MSMPARVAAAAALVVGVAGGTLILIPRGPGVGAGPTPLPSVTVSPGAAVSPSAALVRAAAPSLTLGDWQATSDAAVPGLFGSSEPIQLSIEWQSGRSTWIQTDSGQLLLRSDTLSAAPNEIRLVTSRESDAIGCLPDEIGRYAWSRSADGLFLSLTAIEEACANRRAAMSRTWVHSLSAVTDGKTGVFPFEGGVQMTLPSQRFGLGGADGLAVLRSMEGPERTLVAMEDPLGIDQPCGASRSPIDIPKTTTGFVSYVRTLPGFTVSTEPATVGGRPATHLNLAPKGTAPCIGGEIVAFHGTNRGAADAEWKLTVDDPHSMWIVDMGGGHTALFIYGGAGVTPGEEASVISSFQFLTELPSP